MKELLAAAGAIGKAEHLHMFYAEAPAPKEIYSAVHEKTWILDNTVVLTGSHNWTRHSARKNRENLVVIRDAHDVLRAQARFTNLWKGEKVKEVRIDEGPVAAANLWKDSTGKSSHYGPRADRERSGSQLRDAEPKEDGGAGPSKPPRKPRKTTKSTSRSAAREEVPLANASQLEPARMPGLGPATPSYSSRTSESSAMQPLTWDATCNKYYDPATGDHLD